MSGHRKLMTRLRNYVREQPSNALFYAYMTVLAIGAAAIIVFGISLHPVSVSGSSMAPTYHDGDLLGTRIPAAYDEIRYGDVIVFQVKGHGTLIKRVVALANDIVQVRDGHLIVNGQEEKEAWEPMEQAGLLETPYIVPDGCVLALGDNRNHSLDGREFGAVPFADIRGIVNKEIFVR